MLKSVLYYGLIAMALLGPSTPCNKTITISRIMCKECEWELVTFYLVRQPNLFLRHPLFVHTATAAVGQKVITKVCFHLTRKSIGLYGSIFHLKVDRQIVCERNRLTRTWLELSLLKLWKRLRFCLTSSSSKFLGSEPSGVNSSFNPVAPGSNPDHIIYDLLFGI